MYFFNLLTTVCYLSSVKIMRSTARKILFYFRAFYSLYKIHQSHLLLLILMNAINEYNKSLCQQPICFYEPVSRRDLHHRRRTSALEVIAQHHWINNETAAHCWKLEHHFFNKWFTDKCIDFICGNSWDLIHVMILW